MNEWMKMFSMPFYSFLFLIFLINYWQWNNKIINKTCNSQLRLILLPHSGWINTYTLPSEKYISITFFSSPFQFYGWWIIIPSSASVHYTAEVKRRKRFWLCATCCQREKEERNGWADEVGPHRHTFRVITHGINPPLLFVNVFLFFLFFTNYDISNYYVYMSVVLGSLRFSHFFSLWAGPRPSERAKTRCDECCV